MFQRASIHFSRWINGVYTPMIHQINSQPHRYLPHWVCAVIHAEGGVPWDFPPQKPKSQPSSYANSSYYISHPKRLSLNLQAMLISITFPTPTTSAPPPASSQEPWLCMKCTCAWMTLLDSSEWGIKCSHTATYKQIALLLWMETNSKISSDGRHTSYSKTVMLIRAKRSSKLIPNCRHFRPLLCLHKFWINF